MPFLEILSEKLDEGKIVKAVEAFAKKEGV